jgi:hypothetical protein
MGFPSDMLQMWVFHVRWLKSVTPKYLVSLTSSRICPFKEYLFSIDVLDLVPYTHNKTVTYYSRTYIIWNYGDLHGVYGIPSREM